MAKYEDDLGCAPRGWITENKFMFDALGCLTFLHWKNSTNIEIYDGLVWLFLTLSIFCWSPVKRYSVIIIIKHNGLRGTGSKEGWVMSIDALVCSGFVLIIILLLFFGAGPNHSWLVIGNFLSHQRRLAYWTLFQLICSNYCGNESQLPWLLGNPQMLSYLGWMPPKHYLCKGEKTSVFREKNNILEKQGN